MIRISMHNALRSIFSRRLRPRSPDMLDRSRGSQPIKDMQGEGIMIRQGTKGCKGGKWCLAAVLVLIGTAARAQDVPGIELCTHETRMDKRTGCLQSNIDYLHQLIAKNAADAQQKLNAAA